MPDTSYTISVLYQAKDKASAPLRGMAANADHASRSFGGLKSVVAGTVAALAGFQGLRIASQAFVGFNSSIEQSTISLAAQEKMFIGGSWERAMGRANQLFADYQQVAKSSVGETKDFLEMHQGIAASAYQAGVSLDELKQITVGATIAASVFGERADVTARDVQNMLLGRVESVDKVAKMLLASQGIDNVTFNAMDVRKRREITLKALNDPALKSAAKALGNSFAGQVSTLKDNLQIFAGKVGLPLFKAITAEVKKWNSWIEKNPEKIKAFAETFSRALVTGFNAVRDAMSWVAKHSSLLMKLAEAVLVMKGTQMLGGALGAGAQMLGAGGGSRASRVGGLLGAVYLGANYVAGQADAAQTAGLNATANEAVVKQNLNRFASSMFRGGDWNARRKDAGAAVRAGQDAGFVRNGQVDRSAVYKSLYGWQGDAMARVGTKEGEQIVGGLTLAMKELNSPMARVVETSRSLTAAFGNLAREQAAVDKARIDKTIETANMVREAFEKLKSSRPQINPKIEVTVLSDDPDRFAVALNKSILRAVRNPRGARTALREA